MEYLNAFLCGGILCAAGQILIDKTNLTPARILVGYVVGGVILGGLAGYFMNKYDYPTAPMLLAFVLTPTIEKNLYRALMVNNGSLSIFWERPITLGLLIATVALMVAPVVLKAVRKGKKAEAQQ